MSEYISTLFGDEIVPEQQVAASKSRTRKKVADDIPAAEAEAAQPAAKQAAAKEVFPEDRNTEKKYYSIGEVAELFGVNASQIRFWTNEFKLTVRTTKKGDRLYTAAQVRELRTIRHLVKERGFTLPGARKKLKEQKKIDVETVDLKQSLLRLRNKLLIIRNQLK